MNKQELIAACTYMIQTSRNQEEIAIARIALVSLEAEHMSLFEYCEYASEQVSKWPEWKKKGADSLSAITTRALVDLAALVPDSITADDARWMLKQTNHDDGPSCRVEHAEYIGAILWNDCREEMLRRIEEMNKVKEIKK